MNRREFLAACAAAPLLNAAGSRYRLACATITWPTDRFEEGVESCAQVGYAGVQFRSPEYERYKDRAQELKDKFKRLKLEAVCLSGGSVDARSSERQKYIDRTLEQARYLKTIGCRRIQLLDTLRNSEGVPDAHRVLAGLLNEIGKRTADLGVRLGYHNHLGSLSETRKGCTKLFDALDYRHVGLILDTAHLAKGGSDPVEVFDVYGAHLLFPHFKDAYTGPPKKAKQADGRERELLFAELGDGNIDFTAVLAKMKKHGYRSGWIVNELDVYDTTLRSEKQSVARNLRYCREKLGI